VVVQSLQHLFRSTSECTQTLLFWPNVCSTGPVEKTLRDECCYLKGFKWKLWRRAVPPPLRLLTQWAMLRKGMCQTLKLWPWVCLRPKSSGVNYLPKDPRSVYRCSREEVKGSCKWITGVWVAPLVTCPRRGNVLLEISDFLSQAWPPLATGRNIVHLHPFSLHFLFCFISRVHKGNAWGLQSIWALHFV